MSSTRDLRIDAETVTVTDPSAMPAERTMPLAEAFAGSGRLLFVRDPDLLVATVRTLAARLDDAALPAADRRRVAFWRHLPAGGVPSLALDWTWDRGGGREPVACSLELVGSIARRPAGASDEVPWQLLDDLFVHGPTQPGIPAPVRAALIAHLVAAAPGLDPADAFPAIDHAAIPHRDWTWNQQDDGEEGATIGGATVVAGYRFGHDMGWSEYAVERVVTGAAEIFLLTAPSEILAALLGVLRGYDRPT